MEPLRQVGMDSVVKFVSIGGVIVSTLAQNARDVGSITAVGFPFPIFITLTTISVGGAVPVPLFPQVAPPCGQ